MLLKESCFRGNIFIHTGILLSIDKCDADNIVNLYYLVEIVAKIIEVDLSASLVYY